MTTLDHVLDVLRAHEPELRRRGVLHAGVFGSIARGEDRPDSDVDILVEIDPEARPGLAYFGIGPLLEDALDRRVDIADRSTLKPRMRPHIERDVVHAF